jgi:hypothetical protein
LHVDVTQAAADQGVMPINQNGQSRFGSLLGEKRMLKRVLQAPFHNLLLHRQAIGKRTNLAEHFPFHAAKGTNKQEKKQKENDFLFALKQ